MKFLTIVLLLVSSACFCQIPDIAKDTLQLEELAVTNKDKNLKTKRIKVEGICSTPEDMKDAEEIITLISDVPEGKLESVTFYFNKVDTETYRKGKKYFKASDFKIVFYDAAEDGMPGRPSSIEQEYLVVDKAHRSQITVDLSYLNIDSTKEMYIGLRKLTEDNKSFLLDCLCSGQDKYTTYYRKDTASPWQRRWVCAAIKMDLTIISPRK